MVVIVDRSFKQYYFVMMDVSIINGKTKTVINTFKISNDKIISKDIKYNGYFNFDDYSEEGIKKKIRSINI